MCAYDLSLTVIYVARELIQYRWIYICCVNRKLEEPFDLGSHLKSIEGYE